MKRLPIILVFLMLVATTTKAQSFLKDSIFSAVMIQASYAFHMPSGDLDERFGNSNSMGGFIGYKSKQNIVFGVEGNFLFGNNIRTSSILNSITNDFGQVVGTEGRIAELQLFERGYMIRGIFGKIFQFKKPNVNSGILWTTGFGIMQHKVKIEVDGLEVPQLNAEMRKGYDRLTNGFVLSQFLGYQFTDPGRYKNFTFGVEVNIGFTENRRVWNFDQNAAEEGSRIDLLIGPKFSWVIPIYFKPTEMYR